MSHCRVYYKCRIVQYILIDIFVYKSDIEVLLELYIYINIRNRIMLLEQRLEGMCEAATLKELWTCGRTTYMQAFVFSFKSVKHDRYTLTILFIVYLICSWWWKLLCKLFYLLNLVSQNQHAPCEHNCFSCQHYVITSGISSAILITTSD